MNENNTRLSLAPGGLFDSRQFGFAQVVVIGGMVHVSGQVAWDENREIVGAGDIGLQTKKSLENVAVALASAGATLDQVGSLRLYIKHSHVHEGDAVTRALKETFGNNPLCTTWIAVRSLAREEFLIEIEPSPVRLAPRDNKSL